MPLATFGRTALVHDYFISPGGAEEVAIELAGMLPHSDVFTTFIDDGYSPRLGAHRIHTWSLQRLDAARRRHRSFLPLYPVWFDRLDLREFDLVISSSSAFAKSVRKRSGALHVAYIHAPMRFAWSLDSYLDGANVSPFGRLGARVLRPALQRWDRRTAQRPDVLVANSAAVRDRIKKFWGRDAEVIHPPVGLEGIEPSGIDEGYLLVASRLLAYRRVDLVVEAATRLSIPLVVVGDGPQTAALRKAAGPSVRFLGRVSREKLNGLMERCHAYVVPAEEDFGMAPVEAMGAGKPVVAFRAGGALETVIDGETGVFFDRPAVDGLIEALDRLDRQTFDPARIRAHAEQFRPQVFRERFGQLLERLGVDPHLYKRAAA